MDEFDSDAIQLAYLIDAYAELFTKLYGDRQGWLRQAGEPLNNTFLSYEEIGDLLYSPIPRKAINHARALFFWAGVSIPGQTTHLRAGIVTVIPPINPEVLGWHVLAIQALYHHPEYW